MVKCHGGVLGGGSGIYGWICAEQSFLVVLVIGSEVRVENIPLVINKHCL